MATVTHGLKDGIDEILEKTRALERMLNARKADLEPEEAAKATIIDAVLVDIGNLRSQATLTRAAIDRLNLSFRGR